jgi:hypothetical protein
MDATTQCYNEIPCCSCGSWQRDRVLTRLVLFYLQSEAGQKPKVPTRAELMRGCCRDETGRDDGVTFLVQPPHGKLVSNDR